MAFKVGSKVVHPAHGIAQVVGRESRDLGGERRMYLVLQVDECGWGTLKGMRILLPEDRVDAVGIREPMHEEDAAGVLALLEAVDARVPSNWSRRFKNHQEKLKSGDVYQCAEVVRNLGRRTRDTRLSAAENTMYARARHTLVAELAVTWSVGETEAGRRVDRALGLDPGQTAPVWRPVDHLG